MPEIVITEDDDLALQALRGSHFACPWLSHGSACRPRGGQSIEACHGNKNLSQAMCLKFGCCYFQGENDKITCHTPLVDVIQLTLRLFIFGIVCLILLACIPVCCCVSCQESKLTNKLRGNSEVTKILLSQNDTLENIDDVIESLIPKDEKRKMKKKKKKKGMASHRIKRSKRTSGSSFLTGRSLLS
uniref:Fragile X mental retardation 1 neighbor protein-like n=1 Tax=Phascolarctos cinereus TaxID=38626 RepID=A0A6P5JAK7_PHACI|nr:fragile X mental retardation 1 neighbor protein-like [Phascolarctos cinereus]